MQNLQFNRLKYISFLLCYFLFIACQTTKLESENFETRIDQDSLLKAAEEATRQKIDIPSSFNTDSVRTLNSELDSIFAFLHKKKGFNGTVLLTKYDQVVYKSAFGYADLQRKEPLKTETAFQLASVSKQFTAMAIMILKEQGKLAYDDLVQKFIPEFPYVDITVRQLLTHRSGLSNYTYFSDELWPDRSIPITNDDVINLMVRHQPPVYFKPDSKFNYSNTGYFLLASIVEKASGIPFPDFLQQHIFDPLEMDHTFTFSTQLPSQDIAVGHTRNRRKRTPDYLDTVLGDKGMYSSVEDLYKWDQALYTEKLVSKATLEEALTGFHANNKKVKEDYGFGWRIKALKNGDPVWYHAGLWHGYNTYLLRNPKDHSTIIILSNVANGSLKFLNELQDYLYPTLPPTKTADNQKEINKVASESTNNSWEG
ncbi:serine hydrolase domain-containing protein [Anditalea andensis]|uniref:Beta-lactamase n=1 Tax=Anditalea andensis TaxID=1048983 RepID=A0A074KQW2_9BACT|nr:serine hydrolase domain-containing protein [Anditalea andensis]KEO72351.1 beta-lactamase [Anditalea andensis]